MLQKRILETLEKSSHIDQRKLAQISNVNESTISRYLNGHDEINFEGILRIVKYMFIEDELEIMKAYIPTLKSKNARLALEYCVMNSLWELVEQLIELLSVSTNPVDREWATLYQIIVFRKKKLLTSIEQLEKIDVFKPKELEMQILKTIVKAYIYYELEERNALIFHIKGTDLLIKKVKSAFISDSLSVRLGIIMSYIYLYENDVGKSRACSLSILEQNFYDNVKGAAWYNLGISYILESYDKAYDYLIKALEFFTTHENTPKIEQTMRLLTFLKTHWGIEYEFTHSLETSRDFLSYAYYLIKKGDLPLAEAYLNRIDINDLSELKKAHYYYYKGLLTDDTTYFYYSVESFLYLNDYFHLSLPLRELQRLKEKEVILRILAAKRSK